MSEIVTLFASKQFLCVAKNYCKQVDAENDLKTDTKQ